MKIPHIPWNVGNFIFLINTYFCIQKAHLLEKVQYNIFKKSLTKGFSFLILHSDLKISSNLTVDIANFWLWDDIQNFQTRFLLKKSGLNKNYFKKIILFLILQSIDKLDSNWFISNRDIEFWKRSTFDFIQYKFLSENMTNIKNSSSTKQLYFSTLCFNTKFCWNRCTV